MAAKFDFRLFLDRLSHLSLDFATLQRYTWVLNLFIIFLLAKSASNIVVNYIDHSIEAPTHPEAQTAKAPPPKITYPSKDNFNIITKRNIFNPKAKEEELVFDKKGSGLDEAGATPTSLPLELVGTIILSDASRSIGAIKDKGLNRVESYQVGDLILNKAKVFKVDPYKVYFQNKETGSMEYVELKEDKQLAPPSSGGGGFADAGGGIRQSGEGRFVIDRGALESSLSNPNEILTQARAVPNIVDGKIKGFKIFSIRPGSIYEKLGIQNEDTIERVNGIELDSPSKALEFYGAITSAAEVALDIDRGGQKKSYNYQIK